MNFLLAYWKQAALVVVVILFELWVYHLGGQAPRAELARIAEAGKQQQIATGKINQQQDQNRKDADDALKISLQAAADNAVANYRHRYPERLCHDLPSRTVPATALGEPRHDAAPAESVAAGADEGKDDAFVQSCAADAALAQIWQQWGVRNQIPVE